MSSDDTRQTKNSRFTPNPQFISQEGLKLWFSIVLDTINEVDIINISELLKSGGAYTSYTDPARWLKLLLDQETVISLNRMLLEVHNSGQFIKIDTLVDILCNLITSRRSMKSRRKSLFQAYNNPGLIGRKGSNLDTFVSQLNRDMAACKR